MSGWCSDMSKSILQDEDIKCCFITHARTGKMGEPLHRHHVLNGPLRDFAEHEGLWIWVTPDVHRWLHDTGIGVQIQRHVLKAYAQMKYEQVHSHDEWMKAVKKNYV